jgi:hypothetical protein
MYFDKYYEMNEAARAQFKINFNFNYVHLYS